MPSSATTFLVSRNGIITYTTAEGDDNLSPQQVVFAAQVIAEKIFNLDKNGDPENYKVALRYINPSKGGEQYFLTFTDPTKLRLDTVDCADAQAFMDWAIAAIQKGKDPFYTSDGVLSGDRVVNGNKKSLSFIGLKNFLLRSDSMGLFLNYVDLLFRATFYPTVVMIGGLKRPIKKLNPTDNPNYELLQTDEVLVVDMNDGSNADMNIVFPIASDVVVVDGGKVAATPITIIRVDNEPSTLSLIITDSTINGAPTFDIPVHSRHVIYPDPETGNTGWFTY